MFARELIILSIYSSLLLSCVDHHSEAQEITDNLVQAGFRIDDIQIIDNVVYTGNDAVVTLQASREMLEIGSSNKEQYRTTNLVGTGVENICVDSSALTGNFLTALNQAIANYNDQSLSLKWWRWPFPCPCPPPDPPPPCDITIRVLI